jgi:putative membrane protein
MTEDLIPREERKKVSATDHLANERTFLAWIRTSIAVMGFGFVVVKFSLFVRQLTISVGQEIPAQPKGYSSVIGIALIIIGAVISLLAYFRYKKIEKQLHEGNFYPSFRLSLLTTISIVVISIMMIVYLFLSV